MSNKKDTITFDPGATGVNNGNFFGFPYSLEDSSTVVYPVEWDATTSYGGGASRAPKAVLDASPQLDFFDWDYPNAWENKIGTAKANQAISVLNTPSRAKAKKIISALETGQEADYLSDYTRSVNVASQTMVDEVRKDTSVLLSKGKKVVLLGGDHSTPLGYIQALAQQNDAFSVLHIDAHADLRCAYEGFEYSHASIMYNTLKIPQVKTLVQVAIRDISPAEKSLSENSGGRVIQYDDYTNSRRLFSGDTWKNICGDIISSLGEKVYVSFDIDGLDPSLCPGTGTPVAGGLSFQQSSFLLSELHKSGKTIIGADLNEVCPSDNDDEWDANVGARILYKLCSLVK
ncbi:MAG: agmatinase family protein [Flavobacteriales bacterium]|nr:agmatinase family protein [Flavobacteriales bacterium]